MLCLENDSYCHLVHAADIIMEKMHQYRPEFICEAFDLPSYYTAENVAHNCTHTSKICGPKISFLAEDDVDAAEDDTHTICGDWPFVHPGTYHSTADEKGIASLTMEVFFGFICVQQCLTLSWSKLPSMILSSTIFLGP